MSKKERQWNTSNGAELHRVILDSTLGLPRDEVNWAETLSSPSFDWEKFGCLLGLTGLARGVGGFLKEPLVLKHCPEWFPCAIKELAQGEGIKLAITRQALARIKDALTKLQTHGVLLKGAALTVQSWCQGEPVPAKTPGDIDLLVPEKHALALRDALLTDGFTGIPQESLDPRKNHLEMIGYGTLGIEIHTRIADENWLGRLPESEMLDCCRQVPGWEPFRVLGPEAFLLHTSVHLARHYFTFGLKTMWGQRFTLLNYGSEVDWEQLANWAAKLREERRFWVAIQIFHQDLTFPFPDDFMRRAPSDWRQQILLNYARERLQLTDYSDPLFRKNRWVYESAVRDTWSGWFAAMAKFPSAWQAHRKTFRDRGWLD